MCILDNNEWCCLTKPTENLQTWLHLPKGTAEVTPETPLLANGRNCACSSHKVTEILGEKESEFERSYSRICLMKL
ncbi:Unconventional Myosin-Xviiib [Manis pentadactyla]|nr:Unconventional Myosin-Xviiib [Manis pentadactyla]